MQGILFAPDIRRAPDTPQHLEVLQTRPRSRPCQASKMLGMQTTDRDRQGTDQTTDDRIPRRVSVPEAALLMGISEDAVRSRLRRRTLRKEKAADGTVYVILNETTGTDRPSTSEDQPSTDEPTDKPDQILFDLLREQVEHLREQLDQEREANRENRRIIAALVGRVPELEARGGPAEASPVQSDHPAPAPEGTNGGAPSEPDEQRSWWRRVFG